MDAENSIAVHETEIKYNRLNKDYDLFLNGRYVGSAANHHDGENKLNQLIWDEMTHAASWSTATAELETAIDAAFAPSRAKLAEISASVATMRAELAR